MSAIAIPPTSPIHRRSASSTLMIAVTPKAAIAA
jgi:hypothetical protein